MLTTITTFLSGTWGKILGWGVGILSALGLIITAYENIKGSGEQEQIVADQTKELEDVKVATKIEQTVNVMPAGTAASELLRSYSRD